MALVVNCLYLLSLFCGGSQFAYYSLALCTRGTLAASFTEKTENMDRKSYNVNTKSGRKNIRNKYQNDYQNKSPKEKNELDEMIFWGRAILFVIAMVVCILIVAFGGKIN